MRYYQHKPLYGVKAVEEIQKEGEMEQEAAISGDYSGINDWLGDAKDYISSANSTAENIKNIMEIASEIGNSVSTSISAVTEAEKKQQIELYLTNLKALVDATESRLKKIRRKKWLLFAKVSAGCVAVGTIAYVTLNN